MGPCDIEPDGSDDAGQEASAAASDIGRAVSAGTSRGNAGQAGRTAGSGATERGDEADRRGGRPADAAREALRAARGDGRRERADAKGEEAERPRRARRQARPASGESGRARGRATDARARDVRELLADAFRMPAAAELAGEERGGPGIDPAVERLTQGGDDNDGPGSPTSTDHMSAATAATVATEATAGTPPNPTQPTATARPEPAPSTHHDMAMPEPVPSIHPGPATPASPPPHHPGPTQSTPTRTGRPEAAEPEPASAQERQPGTARPTPAQPQPSAPLSARPPTGTSTPTPPATPRVPHSMAAPGRDSELRRTFPAFPPRTGAAGFAATWWGNAWVAALEEGALDAKRLARGRGYAEQGNVDAITVTPGLVLAYVQGSRPRPYRVQVRLRTLDDTDWARFLDSAADRPGHIAALLDREMPHSLAECGVRLLPGPGELEPHCSCPDRGHPCKHAAALCYQTARLLDADPFVLLLLRGRGERDLLDALSRLSATRAARAAQERGPTQLPGVRATDALAPRALPPLPAPLPPPPHPEQPPAYPAAPGGPDPFALDQLATDAAARAHALLGTGRDPVGELTLWQDAVRLAAARPGSGLTAGSRALYASLASAAGRAPAELARAVAAWRQGGPAGLAVLEEAWDPPAGRFDRARPLLLAADLPAFRPWRNRLTHPQGHVQLRLGRDGLWYAYESEPGHDDWWPRGTPDLDPVGALTGLGTPDDL
ncbi:SWIM zinc finger family protein [Streptomyces sp. NL15-2K]|uniref:SWIM zinc finger family protein n=1 Tax=Streptomyces sp. NL15-2K TaxID=376149 RepID=UPI00209C2EA3|nr:MULTISPECIES: SWIM zinc finger family protein [Actinomycetes]WKX13859.1 SWIM zinc finger family protein [Kutzneria buriramensis]